MQSIKEQIGRKGVVVAVAALLITGAFVLVGINTGLQPGDFKEYASAIIYLTGIYVGGNVGEHFSKKDAAPK